MSLLTFDQLARATTARNPEWGDTNRTPEFRACELAGEVGEVCNEVKKLARFRMGLVGGKTTCEGRDDLADELGDVVICCELLASQFGIDLGEAVHRKFNKTSFKHDFSTFIQPLSN